VSGSRAATVIKWIAVSVALTAALLWFLDIISPPGSIFAGAVAILIIPIASRRQSETG
jgi:hypothetical protein